MKKYNYHDTTEEYLIGVLNHFAQRGYRILTVIPEIYKGTQIYKIIYEEET